MTSGNIGSVTKDLLTDPMLQAAAFTGGANNKHYSFAQRLELALAAIKILEGVVHAGPRPGPRVWKVDEIPEGVFEVLDRHRTRWTRNPSYPRWKAEGGAIDDDGYRWLYADSNDLVVTFGPITEVIEPSE